VRAPDRRQPQTEEQRRSEFVRIADRAGSPFGAFGNARRAGWLKDPEGRRDERSDHDGAQHEQQITAVRIAMQAIGSSSMFGTYREIAEIPAPVYVAHRSESAARPGRRSSTRSASITQ